jgi:hypothetical protein
VVDVPHLHRIEGTTCGSCLFDPGPSHELNFSFIFPLTPRSFVSLFDSNFNSTRDSGLEQVQTFDEAVKSNRLRMRQINSSHLFNPPWSLIRTRWQTVCVYNLFLGNVLLWKLPAQICDLSWLKEIHFFLLFLLHCWLIRFILSPWTSVECCMSDYFLRFTRCDCDCGRCLLSEYNSETKTFQPTNRCNA